MSESKETEIIAPVGKLAGQLTVPGDKSVGHRALMMGACAKGDTVIRNLPSGLDNLSTREVLRTLGVVIEDENPAEVIVHGTGGRGFVTPESDLDCGNSGTTMRLMTGLLAGQGVACTLTGDASLSARPMGRVTKPLNEMGYDVKATGEGQRPPVVIEPTDVDPSEFTYASPVASAQVKSCILLASLRSPFDVVITEPAPSRDHTEQMLRYLGYRVETSSNYYQHDGQRTYVRLFGHDDFVPAARPITVPGDISSAAFFLVAAALTQSDQLLLESVSINPTRTGILDVLRAMGVKTELSNRRVLPGNEAVADLRVIPGPLSGATIGGDLIPRAIDEIPVLAVLATAATGDTVFDGIQELRVKESDRVETTSKLLQAAGCRVDSDEST
ncbi:MAG: 3-phosphoshikimate 1-carboxyvinyltransferase, partial [Myxococcales bacterium]|nr:3-phosphoshikimate 1-carboxyvinyltransferase [Myxococcales bacterium]